MIEAADGPEAVATMAARGAEVELILLDATMPRMDGAETLEAIRCDYPDVPVLVCSGYHEQHVVGRFEGLGLVGFLHKPFPTEALIARVRQILAA
ncbi:MAG: response regulator transcription factor [Armatimonadetes bacterium]|nr:response regulator transcription factor [Armatimonadota bacterium]